MAGDGGLRGDGRGQPQAPTEPPTRGQRNGETAFRLLTELVSTAAWLGGVTAATMSEGSADHGRDA